MRKRRGSMSERFEALSEAVTRWTGSTSAFASALGIILVWGVLGPVFGYSDTWQLVINTGTTVVTFLMVFLIQRTQNKDALAIHLKLNELVAALESPHGWWRDTAQRLLVDPVEVLDEHHPRRHLARGAQQRGGAPHHQRTAQRRSHEITQA